MPIQLRKLSQDEAARAFPRRGQMDLSDYADALRGLQPGESAEVELGGLTSRAAKRRLGQAATQVGYRLKWARTTSDDRLFFQVVALTGAPAARASNGRRGRAARRPTPEAPTSAPSAASSQSQPARRGRGRRARS